MGWVNGWGVWIHVPDTPTPGYPPGSVNDPASYAVHYGDQGSTATSPPSTPAANTPTQADLQKLQDQQTAAMKANTDRTAKGQINSALAAFGLSSLGQFAWNEYLKDIPVEQIMLDIRNTPEYKQRFPAMAALSAKGQAITESEYINYEKGASALMEAAGLPKGFYDTPQDFASFLTNDIALPELQSRINLAKQAVYNSDPETLSALQQYYHVQGGGNHIGDATAYFLDPNKALPAIEQQMLAAREGGAATRAGYTGLSQSYAERLANMNIDPLAAQQKFGSLAGLAPLFQALPGEAGPLPTSTQGLQATFEDNAAAQLAVSNVQDRRKAVFNAGGSFSGNANGMTGL